MEVYILIMYCLSSFGLFTIVFSMYLLLTVPTKLTAFSRFVIHGHDLISGICQLFGTLCVQAHVIFPCASGYTTGLFTQFGILSTLNQTWILVALIAATASFSLLVVIQRALAVSMRIPDKWKSRFIKLYLLQFFTQVVCSPIVGLNLKDGGEKARKICKQKIKYYPKEMDTLGGINMIVTQDIFNVFALLYVLLCALSYMVVATVGGTILIRSIREQGKMTQSAQFLANQRRITTGIIYFMMLELIGVGVPVVCFALCCALNIGSLLVSSYIFISMSTYTIFSPYCVLMPNTDYRKKVNGIWKRAREMTQLPRSQSVTIIF